MYLASKSRYLFSQNTPPTLLPFSNTYTQVQERADIIWKCKRYQLIRDYGYRPLLPPPLTVVYFVYRVVYRIFQCINRSSNQKGCDPTNGKSRE